MKSWCKPSKYKSYDLSKLPRLPVIIEEEKKRVGRFLIRSIEPIKADSNPFFLFLKSENKEKIGEYEVKQQV